MKKIGDTLKKLRNERGLSVEQIVEQLETKGYSIKRSTYYGYENNHNSVNADMFIAICQILECDNIHEVFSGVEVDYSRIGQDEQQIISKYRSLDENGKRLIRMTLDHEYDRCHPHKEKKENAS